jgi:hypothetical protein
MKTHLKQAHSDVCVDSSGCGSFLIGGVTPAANYSKVICVYSDVFCIFCEIQNGILYAVLQYIGPAEEAAIYQYKVELFNEERTESLADTHLARSFHEILCEIHSPGNCVKLFPDQFNRFIFEKG